MSKKILVVDDSQAPRLMLKEEFERQGCEVTTANSGEEALEKVKTVQPDVVLTDTVMPGIDGFEVCRQIKHESFAKPPKVVIMTGTLEAVNAKKAREAGADDYCAKTSDFQMIVDAVKNFL